MESIFDKILKNSRIYDLAKRVKSSQGWLDKTIRNTATKYLLSGSKSTPGFPGPTDFIGRMYMYNYDPKTKESLPYYDTFPLIIGVNIYDDGFLGINLHYLPYNFRAELFYHLLKITNNDKFDESTKFKISYKVLQSASKYRAFEPCLKRYLYQHVKSKVLNIPPDEWEMALFLPVHKFEKASADSVWSDSARGLS